MNLNELYTQIITENSRSKENRHPVEGATHSLEGVNPSVRMNLFRGDSRLN